MAKFFGYTLASEGYTPGGRDWSSVVNGPALVPPDAVDGVRKYYSAWLDESIDIIRGAWLEVAALIHSSRKAKLLDLNAVVLEMRDILRPLVGDEVDLEIRADPSLEPVIADRAEVQEAVENLVVNARSAIKGGGALTIRTYNAQPGEFVGEGQVAGSTNSHVLVSVSCRPRGAHATDDESLRRILRPLALDREIGSRGLGLAIASRIARRRGGSVLVSGAGQGGPDIAICLPSAAELLK